VTSEAKGLVSLAQTNVLVAGLQGTAALPRDKSVALHLIEVYRVLCNVLSAENTTSSIVCRHIQHLQRCSQQKERPVNFLIDNAKNTFTFGSLVAARQKTLYSVGTTCDSCAYLFCQIYEKSLCHWNTSYKWRFHYLISHQEIHTNLNVFLLSLPLRAWSMSL
jgi:hypothetical protein